MLATPITPASYVKGRVRTCLALRGVLVRSVRALRDGVAEGVGGQALAVRATERPLQARDT